jgi:hypothetical protein
MLPTAAFDTVFAVLVQNVQFPVSYPVALTLLLVCAAAWILMIMDIRRSSKEAGRLALPSLEEIDREFSRLIRR